MHLIFILAGASRGVGREIAQYLRAQQLKVKALLRTAAVAAELEGIGIEVVLGDALNVGDVERAILADEPIHTVISTIGGLPSDVERPDYPGNKSNFSTARCIVEMLILMPVSLAKRDP